MGVPIIFPMTVSAKVILADTQVPTLGGGAFNRGALLERGIHVHWALPDNMTKATLLPEGGKNVALFMGVPDLWLVVRFNPGPPIEQKDAKRTWLAWIVDSVQQKAVPLNSWVAPASRDPKLIHTAAGMLPSAADLGYYGYGVMDSSQKEFDPAIAAYYPESRNRFGFYDSVSDLSGAKGSVSYVVIGWFADRGYDPLYMANDKLGLLNDWKVAHGLRSNSFDEICTTVQTLGGAVEKPKFNASIAMQDVMLEPGKELDFARRSARGGTQGMISTKADAMQASFPLSESESHRGVNVLNSLPGPLDTILHGSVVEVPLKGPVTVPGDIEDKDIHLYPTVRRAMAELAAMNVTETSQVDAIEMMLDDLASMNSSLAGVIDMPGMAHAATFQNVPGKSQWYARIEIQPKDPPWEAASAFGVEKVHVSSGYEATGHWPKMSMRSASNKQDWMLLNYPPESMVEPVIQSDLPSANEHSTWSLAILNAFDDTAKAAAAGGKKIDPNLVNVIDRRKDAQPSTIGTAAGRGGSDGASWWIDVNDPQAIRELLRSSAGGKVVLPTIDNLFEVPGPRWNRPWSPQLVLLGTGRSFKFGDDGRFEVDGYMKTRMSGETTTGIAVGANAPVYGRDIMDNPAALLSKPGLPSEARGLINEALLLDTESAGVMANLSAGERAASKDVLAAQKQMKSAIRGLWLSRDQKAVAANKANLKAVACYGTFPSDIAPTPWQNPRDPLFVDVNYSHPHSSLAADWTLDQDCVEMKATGKEATNPSTGTAEVIEERTRVTASIVKVLTGALVTNKTLDPKGELIRRQKPPKDVTEDTFMQMDVISTPLTSLDSTLISRGFRERSGALRLNRLELVDMFGVAREWKSNIPPASSHGDEKLPYWIELAPRIPGWARLLFRLQQADAPDKEANPLAHPVCGILVPDFVEHALEVFDGNGKALGQLTTDRPRFGGGPGSEEVSLETKFELHPWYAAKKNIAPGSDLDGIDNPKLNALVDALTHQGIVIPANGNNEKWFETGMSAMLRSIDTIRGTLDPSKATDDKRIKLLGEPILVLAARLSYQATAATSPTEIANDPPLLDSPPAMTTLTVRVGDSTRPDDGVFGCFLQKDSAESARFAPVDKGAAEYAILNGLSMGVSAFFGKGLEVTHPFVAGQESVFKVEANKNTDLVILADPRGGLYATCGALPRKNIILPREFIQASIKHLEPTFRVGPIFTNKIMGSVKALVPPPKIDGLDVEYVYRKPAEQDAPETFPSAPVAPVPPVGELPKDRVTLTDGWMRVFKPKAS